MNFLSLKNKNIFITGASSGIGRACAIGVSEYGGKCILVGRNKKRLEETISLMKGKGHIYRNIDITEYDILPNLIEESVAKLGKISGFIHSAGIETTRPLHIMKPEIYEEMFSINVITAFEISKLLSKKKYASEYGSSFIYISSVMGILGARGRVSYCSSKSALLGGSKALALELAEKKIRVNCISPSLVNTTMVEKYFSSIPQENVDKVLAKHPLGIGEPKDVANACLFLLADVSKWITGTNLIIDGGYSAK